MKFFLLLPFVVAVPCSAQPVSVAPWMTGAQIAEQLRWPDNAATTFDLTPSQRSDRDAARAYIVGVHDATEGRRWCFSQKYKPGPEAIQEQVTLGLMALPKKELKRNAADLIVEILASTYPCKPSRSTP